MSAGRSGTLDRERTTRKAGKAEARIPPDGRFTAAAARFNAAAAECGFAFPALHVARNNVICSRHA